MTINAIIGKELLCLRLKSAKYMLYTISLKLYINDSSITDIHTLNFNKNIYSSIEKKLL